MRGDQLIRRSPGDWDTGVGTAADGPYVNKGDDGDVRALQTDQVPYFDQLFARGERLPANQIPERMALPGQMGSLPTGARSNTPWQTLLFRPAPPENHYGARGLPDHVFLDLFRMPIVGPSQNRRTVFH